MSDELFDKLEVIENKSLFIRKLIERELDAADNFSSEEVVPWSEGFSILKNDVTTIFSRLEEMEGKLAGISLVKDNQPLMQEPLSPMAQEIPEEIPTPQENLTQTIGNHESPAPSEQMPVEDIITPDITESISAEHPDIPAPLEADTGIAIENMDDVASNIPDMESFRAEELENIETQIPEQSVPTGIQEAVGTVPSVETSAQEITPMETAITEGQITPDEGALPVENNEATFSQSIPETEVKSAVNSDIPHEHKLSELVAEKIQKEAEIETAGFNEPEIPSFTPSEQNKPEQEMAQTEFQMPEMKPPEQEIAQADFQMPEMKPPEQEMAQTDFQMPELKPPEQEMAQADFQMPELKPPEQEMAQTEFQMPELKPPEQEIGQADFQMPELKPPEQEMAQADFQMPELKPPEQEMAQTEFQMPELKPPEQEMAQTEFQMPEMKPPEQEIGQADFQMPELKPPEQEMAQTDFQMPELKPPEQEMAQTEFQIPELKPPEQEMAQTEFQMPELKPPEQEIGLADFQMPDMKPPDQGMGQTAFAMPELQTPEIPVDDNAGITMPEMKPPEIPHSGGEAMPPFNPGTEAMPEMQSAAPQMQAANVQSNPAQDAGVKPDKLETNILMYMPRGAKVKKEIIKSLVSRQFSQEDIDRKIQELVAREILILKQENGVEQLHRLK